MQRSLAIHAAIDRSLYMLSFGEFVTLLNIPTLSRAYVTATTLAQDAHRAITIDANDVL